MAEKTAFIRTTSGVLIHGEHVAEGEALEVDLDTAALVITAGRARRITPEEAAAIAAARAAEAEAAAKAAEASTKPAA